MACKQVMRYLKATSDYGFKFVSNGKVKLTGFTDVDWAYDLDDTKSIGAYCICIDDNMISWSSKKQFVITKSSAGSEYRALASNNVGRSWLQSLFSELGVCCTEKPTI